MTDCHFPGQFLNGERADLVSQSLSFSDAESTSVCIPILNTTEVTNAGLRFSGEKSNVKNTDNQTTYPKKGVRDSSDIEQAANRPLLRQVLTTAIRKIQRKRRKTNNGLYTHMLKTIKSKYGEDVLLVAVCKIVCLGITSLARTSSSRF